LFLFFIVLIFTSTAILVVNLTSKESFLSNVVLTEDIKNVRNRMESSKLHILYMYAIANSRYTNLT
jgi:hypothetical protein